MELNKELSKEVSLHAEIKDGKASVQISVGLGALVQMADDKIENPIISALLQIAKGAVEKL